tara:strand:- start:166 stop:381 length:216 start_codon:yes stop_codon:yes gene_type:complete
MMPPNGASAPVPDNKPGYSAVSMANNGYPPNIGGATVSGGRQIGDTWYGCTYVAGPYVIPGLGDVKIDSIG